MREIYRTGTEGPYLNTYIYTHTEIDYSLLVLPTLLLHIHKPYHLLTHMHPYIRSHTHAHIHIHTHTPPIYIHTFHTEISGRLYVCIYIYIYAGVCVCVYECGCDYRECLLICFGMLDINKVCVCACVCVCVCMRLNPPHLGKGCVRMCMCVCLTLFVCVLWSVYLQRVLASRQRWQALILKAR